MSLYDVALLRNDTAFILRAAAAYAAGAGIEDPDLWATEHAWDLAGAAGLADAYGAAVTAANANPGSDPTVITDAALEAAVAAVGGP